MTTVPSLPRPRVSGVLFGLVRYAAVLALVVAGSVVMMLARLAPVRIRDVPLPVWWAVAMCRVFLWITGVRLHVDRPDVIRAHRGFLFFNHLTFIDGLVIMAITPVRFLSMAEVRWIPFVGAMARAVGTIFVRRNRPRSRASARDALHEAVEDSPMPVALAPEGKIGPGPGVLPLRRGAFRVAAEAEAPILLVALRFDPLAYGTWPEGAWPTRLLWRFSARTAPFTVHVAPLLPPLDPTAASPADVAEAAQLRFDEALREPWAYDEAHPE